MTMMLFTHATHHQMYPGFTGCFGPLSQYTLSRRRPTARLIRPRCVPHGVKRSFSSPYSILPLLPQPVTACFSGGSEIFDDFSLGLPSNVHILKEPCGGPHHKSPAVTSTKHTLTFHPCPSALAAPSMEFSHMTVNSTMRTKWQELGHRTRSDQQSCCGVFL